MKSLLPIAMLPCLLMACAKDDTRYPSLARRAVEDTDFRDPPEEAPVAIVADPALDGSIASLRGRLRTIAAGFDRDAAAARRLANAGGARSQGSEAWLAAQTALAALDDWRAQAGSVAADADKAAIARADRLVPPYPALEALQRAIAEEIARQDAALGSIQGA